MKSIISIILILSTICFLFSCSNNTIADTTIDNDVEDPVVSSDILDVKIEPVVRNNELPYADFMDLIMNQNVDNLPNELDKISIFDYKQFLFNNHYFSIVRDPNLELFGYSGINKTSVYITDVYSSYPSPSVRTINVNGSKNMYFMYELTNGCRAYLFFDEKDDYNLLSGYPIIMYKTLCLEDFSGIKIGSSILSVASVDPIALIYKNIYDELPESDLIQFQTEKRNYISAHLLKDCFLFIEYEYNQDNILVVKSFNVCDDYFYETNLSHTNYRIYSNDYVK